MADEPELETQPEQGVTTQTEETGIEPDVSPSEDHADNEVEGLVIDVEDGQTQTSKFDTSSPEYKAFRKSNEAKKRKNAIIAEMMQERQQTASEIARMRAELDGIKKGKPPDIDDFLDDKEFQEATRKYYESPTNTQAGVSTDNHQRAQLPNALNEQVEYEHFVQEQEVKKSFADYDESVNALKHDIHNLIQRNSATEVPFDDVVNAMLNTGNTAKINMPKALLAVSKIPSLHEELMRPEVLSSDILFAELMRKAEKAIKSGNRVSNAPPVNVKQGGPIDNRSKAIEKARAQWMESGSSADFNKLRALKREK